METSECSSYVAPDMDGTIVASRCLTRAWLLVEVESRALDAIYRETQIRHRIVEILRDTCARKRVHDKGRGFVDIDDQAHKVVSNTITNITTVFCTEPSFAASDSNCQEKVLGCWVSLDERHAFYMLLGGRGREVVARVETDIQEELGLLWGVHPDVRRPPDDRLVKHVTESDVGNVKSMRWYRWAMYRVSDDATDHVTEPFITIPAIFFVNDFHARIISKKSNASKKNASTLT